MKVIIATQNPVKVNDVRSHTGFNDALTIEEAVQQGLMTPMGEDVEETGTTYLQNAIIKAKAVWSHTINPVENNIFVLADDSGFEIEALDNQPGLYSHRLLGYDTTPLEKAAKIIEIMKDKENRKIKCISCCVLLMPDGKRFVETEGEMEGIIPEKVSLDTPVKRSAYAKVMYVKQIDSFLDDADEAALGKYSHRGKALNKMTDYISQYRYWEDPTLIVPTGYIED